MKRLRCLVVIFCLLVMSFSLNAATSKMNYFFLYNSEAVTQEDLVAMNGYLKKFNAQSINCVLKDVRGMDVYEIYEYLSKKEVGAVQIFGTSIAVPSFFIRYHLVTPYGSEELAGVILDGGSGYYATDYFYSHLNNPTEELKKFTVKAYCEGKSKVNLLPELKVVRLPLNKGDYTAYFSKYEDYLKTKPSVLPLASFSKTIFGQSQAPLDDLNYWVKGLLDYEAKSIDNSQYSLYGSNQFGEMTLGTKGEFSLENMKAANKMGIQNFIISYHGNKEGIYQVLNRSNIETSLNQNYYNANLVSCFIAEEMDQKNLVYKMLKGKGIYVLAPTSYYLNGGIELIKDSHYMLEDQNYRKLLTDYYKNLYKGMNATKSFFEAQKSYATYLSTIALNKINQCQLHNLMVYHQFGLLEYQQVEKPYTYKDTLTVAEKQAIESYYKQMNEAIEKNKAYWEEDQRVMAECLSKDYNLSFSYDGSANRGIYEVYEGIEMKSIDYERIGNEIAFKFIFESSEEGWIILREEADSLFLYKIQKGLNEAKFNCQLEQLLRKQGHLDFFCPMTTGNHFVNIKIEEK